MRSSCLPKTDISPHRRRPCSRLPLYTTCSRHWIEVVKLLVDSNASKRTLHTRADNRSLPLHSAVRYQAPTGMVMLLLGSVEGRRMLLELDAYSKLPLHAACRNGAHTDVIYLLLAHDKGKSTVMQEDHAGRVRRG
jgi:ankyrin repeat protein